MQGLSLFPESAKKRSHFKVARQGCHRASGTRMEVFAFRVQGGRRVQELDRWLTLAWKRPVVKRPPCCLSQCVLCTVAALWNPPVLYLRPRQLQNPSKAAVYISQTRKSRQGEVKCFLQGCSFRAEREWHGRESLGPKCREL